MTIKTSSTNRSLCELCHVAPGDTYSRNDYARHVGARYVQTRTNRTRIDDYMANQSGYPQLTNLMLCDTCYHMVSYLVNNQRHMATFAEVATRCIEYRNSIMSYLHTDRT